MNSASIRCPSPRLQAGLALAFIVASAFVFLGSPGTGDVTGSSLPWMKTLGEQGLIDGYATIGADYPPLSHVFLWLIQLASDATGVSPLATFKLSLLAFGLVATVVLLAWQRSPLLLIILFLVWGPNAMALGYLDVMYLPFLIGTFWALERGRHGFAATLFAIALLIKWQPIIVAPFLLAYAWRSPAQTARAAMPAVLVVVLAFVVFGWPMLDAFRISTSHDVISGNAVNVQWLITAVLQYFQIGGYSLDEDGGVHYITGVHEMPWLTIPTRLALAAVYLWILVGFILSQRDFVTLLYCSMTAFLSYFVINIGVHENHLFVPALLATFLLPALSGQVTIAALIILVNDINMIVFYGLNGTGMGFMKSPGGFDITIPLAVLTTLLLIVCVHAAPCPIRPRAATPRTGILDTFDELNRV